jgi:nucleoside-diphosphate-sugar epimerase
VAVTVFRPTLIYGAGTDASLAPLARFARRWHLLPIPLGARGLRQPVHADDLAAACVAALDVPATHGRVYALGGGERLSAQQMFRRIATAVPGWVLPVPIPVTLLQRISGRSRRAAVLRLRQDLVADNVPAQADFGFAPRVFDARGVIPVSAKSI